MGFHHEFITNSPAAGTFPTAGLFIAYVLFHENQFILSASQSNFLCMLQAGLILRLRSRIYKVIVMVAEMFAVHIVG